MGLVRRLNTCNHQLAVLIIIAVALVFSAVGGVVGNYLWSRQGWGELGGLFVFSMAYFAWEGNEALGRLSDRPRHQVPRILQKGVAQ